MIFLSIVIPHYNLARELLMRCVKSICDQNIPTEEYEIIVVDDNSSDPPTWLNSAFEKENIRVIEIEHGGPGAARNKGIEEARGEYIQFIDADDCLLPDSLDTCLDIIHTEKPKIFRFRYKICTSEHAALSNVNNKKIKYSNIISGAAFMASNNLPGSPCLYIFEREVVIKNNIRFATGVYHEDDEFNTKLHYHATSLIDSNAVIYNYCIRKGSITSNSNPEFEKKRIEDLFLLLQRLSAFRKECQGSSNTIQKRGIDRKMTMLTVDTIVNLLYNGQSAKELSKLCNTRLRPLGLYPLPQASYSIKYRIFRILANSPLGLFILRLVVPKRKPHKK